MKSATSAAKKVSPSALHAPKSVSSSIGNYSDEFQLNTFFPLVTIKLAAGRPM